MNEHSLLQGLESARDAVQRALAAFEVHGDLDLRDVERQVDLAAAAATSAQGEDRVRIRSALINLVADLNGLQSRIGAESRKTADLLGHTAVSRRAVVAYGQRG